LLATASARADECANRAHFVMAGSGAQFERRSDVKIFIKLGHIDMAVDCVPHFGFEATVRTAEASETFYHRFGQLARQVVGDGAQVNTDGAKRCRDAALRDHDGRGDYGSGRFECIVSKRPDGTTWVSVSMER
jgi:hypothetical protein